MGNSIPSEIHGVNCITCGKSLKGIDNWDYLDHTGTLYTFTPPDAEQYFRKEGRDYYQCERCFKDPDWEEKAERASIIVDHNIQKTESIHHQRPHHGDSDAEETNAEERWETLIQEAGNTLNKDTVSELLKGLWKYPEIFKSLTLEQIESFSNALGSLLVEWGHKTPSDVPIDVFHWIHVFLVGQYLDYNQFDLSETEKSNVHHVLASMFSSVLNIRELVEVTTCVYQISDTSPYLDIYETLTSADDVAAGFIHLLLSERFSETGVDEPGSHSEWPRDACLALVNILIEQHQKDEYDFRQALSKLVNGKVWKPMEVMDLTLAMLKYIKSSEENDLAMALEELITSQSGTTLGVGESSVSQLLEEKGPKHLLQMIRDDAHEVDHEEKDIDALCKEMLEKKLVDENTLCTAKKVTLYVLDHLKSYGYNMHASTSTLDFDSHIPKSLVEVCIVVKDTEGYWPRINQILTCALLYSSKVGHGRLIEMATGEGKSCIIAMYAALLAIEDGRAVDVVTSSPLLAKRDCKQWKMFYEYCGLTVSNNIDLVDDYQRQKCYEANIVYGTVGSFASDVLRQEFHLRQTRGSRDIKSAVIVDEVDFMLLDRGVQFTYLSDKTLGLHHLEPILATIWAIVSRFTPMRVESEQYFHDKPLPFYKTIESIIDPNLRVGINEIREFARSAGILEKFPEMSPKGQSDNWLSDIESNEMMRFFEAARGVLQKGLQIYQMKEIQGKYVPVNVNPSVDDDTNGHCSTAILVLEKGLCLVLCKSESTLKAGIVNTVKHYTSPNSESHINVPIHLQDLVEHMVPVWVENAFQATHMTKDREYHIRDGKVLPVDFGATGVIEVNRKWGDGLQQFVELKHHLQLSEIAFVTNYMSNLEFFHRYARLYGVTGTLGSEADQDFLVRHFKVDLCHVPTHKQRKLYEDRGQILQNEAEWKSAITKEVLSEVKKSKWRKDTKAALVICEDIISAEKVARHLRCSVPGQLHVYTGKGKGTNTLPELEVRPGDVIVATNLAGRGTDIKVTDEVNKAGGLFVIVSFLPATARVEMQAFGRTGRKGQPGSAKLLINYERLPLIYRQNCGSVQELRMTRELLAKDKLELMIHSEVAICSAKDELFKEYCIHLKTATEKFKNIPEKDRKLAIMYLHDQWGLWLQMKSDDIRGVVSKSDSSLAYEMKNLNSSLKRMIDATVQSIHSKESKNIYYVIRSGNNLMLKSNFNQATKCYDAAVILNSTWASIALYNRAYCTIKLKKDGYKMSAMSDLKMCLEELKDYKEEVQITLHSAHCSYSKQHAGDSTKTKTDLVKYLEMKQHVLHLFERNVQKAIQLLQSLKHSDDAKAILEPIMPAVHVDKIEKDELKELGFQGLPWFFSLKKVTHFCWSGALAAFLGVVQVAAGIFLSAVSAGTLAEVGALLVIEGVSDIYAGIKGMYTGDFDWKSWATGKAMSIVISVATFGIGTFINAGAKGLAVAIKEVGPGLREIPSLMRSQIGTEALEKAAINSCKDAGVEVLEQGGQELIGTAVDTSVEYLMVEIEKKTMASIRNNIMEDAHSGKISKSIDFVAKHMLTNESISSNNLCFKVRQKFKDTAKDLTSKYTTSPEWKACVQQIAVGIADGLSQRHPENKTVTLIGRSIRMLQFEDGLVESETRTEKLLGLFKSELHTSLHKDLANIEGSKEIGSKLEGKWESLKEDIGDDLGRILSTAIQDIWRTFFVGNVTFEVSRKFNKHLSEKTEELLGRHKIRDELAAGVASLHAASMPPDLVKSVKPTKDVVQEYKRTLSEGDEMASVMDARILSERLGKHIVILNEDQNGRTLLRVGSNQADVITVAYEKPDGNHKYGHYNAVVDGKLIRVENEGNNCFFHAVALAEGSPQENAERDSKHLKDLAAKELDENPEKWGQLITRTNQARAISHTLMIVGGAKDEVTLNERGMVMRYCDAGQRENVEVDHQPPCQAYKLGLETSSNTPLVLELRELCDYDKTSSKVINKEKLAAVVTSKSKHRYILTTGSLRECVAARNYIAKSIKAGDSELMLKATILASSVDVSRSVYDHRKVKKKVLKKNNDYKLQTSQQFKLQNKDLIKFWHTKLSKKALSDKQYHDLEKWVDNERYRDPNDSTRKALCNDCINAIPANEKV